ncbi:MAG: hypothetical protein ACFB13_10465 [Kiloniellaceae bacterium]
MPSVKDIAFVGCRLLALFLLFNAVLGIAFNTRFFFMNQGMSHWSLSDRVMEFGFYAIPLAFLIAMFAFLWWGAGWIAGKATADMPAASASTAESWSRHSLLSLVVTAAGLWALIQHLPVAVSYFMFFVWADSRGRDSTGLIAELLIIGLGLVCVLGPGRIAGTIVRLRRWSAERHQG